MSDLPGQTLQKLVATTREVPYLSEKSSSSENRDWDAILLKSCQDFISHNVFLKSFGKSQLPHKFVILFLILVIIKDRLTESCGN